MRYHDPDSMTAAVAACAGRAGSRAVTSSLGSSVGGRDLVAVTVSAPGRGPDRSRPQVLVAANIHGIEVIGAEVALGILDALCAAEPEGAAADLLSRADVTVVPAVNPDARHDALVGGDRPFRLPPRRNGRGVDLNRNFPYPPHARDVWHPLSGTGVRWLPWYRGPRPLSEPETAALAALASDLRPAAAVNLHSAGRLFLYPYCYTAEEPADVEVFRAMGEAFRAAQPRWRYEVRQSRSWYTILGDLDDWLYESFGTLSVTVEIGRPFEGVGLSPPRLVRPFWWANPPDPQAYVRNDATACCAALAEALRRRGGSGG